MPAVRPIASSRMGNPTPAPRLDYIVLRGLFNITDGQAGKGGNPAPATGNGD